MNVVASFGAGVVPVQRRAARPQARAPVARRTIVAQSTKQAEKTASSKTAVLAPEVAKDLYR